MSTATSSIPPSLQRTCWTQEVRSAAAALPAGETFDVVVVGAGLAGCSTALHLAESRPELRVALVDAQGPGAGASGRGTGLLGPRLGPPVEVAMRRLGPALARSLHLRSEEALALATSLAARWAPEAISACAGQLVVGTTPLERRVVLRRAQAYRDLGLDVQLVPPGHPARPAGLVGPALHHRQAAGVDPYALTVGLAAGAARAGVLVVGGTAVAHLLPDARGLTRVITSGGSVLARAVVVTVDAAEPGLDCGARGLLDLEVSALATEVLPGDVLAALGGPGAAHVLSTAALGGYRRLTPEGRLVIGGGPVLAWRGLDADGLRQGRAAAWSWQETCLRGILPARADVSVKHRWSGRITVTRDGLPVLGRRRGTGEVWYAGGWNGHGLAATVAAGAQLAELVLAPAAAAAHPGSDLLWRPARSWLLSHPRLRRVVRTYLATQVPPAA